MGLAEDFVSVAFLIVYDFNVYIIMDGDAIGHIPQPGVVGKHILCPRVVVYHRLPVVNTATVFSTNIQQTLVSTFFLFVIQCKLLSLQETKWIVLSYDVFETKFEKVIERVKMMSNKVVGIVSEIAVNDVPRDLGFVVV